MTPPLSGPLAGVRAWWRQREPRERAMLATMIAALAAFAWWYGALVPLRQARDEARVRHAQAAAEWTRVQSEIVQLVALEGRMPARPSDDTGLRNALREAARQAGLTVEIAQGDGEGQVEVGCDAAVPAALFAWLDQLRSRHGLAPDRLSVAKNNGGLRVHAVFRSPP